ncbi:MAG: glycerophosphodiester phosphodiesterase [Lachnospiraceae bacterium]
MKRTLVWAHRGASGYAPENTLKAFQKAVELGADGIELDVQMTKDGQLVVIHDETVERTSSSEGWVKDYLYEDLRKLDVNRNFPEYGRAGIPALEEVYRLLKPTGLQINTEIKTGIVFYEGIEEKVLALAASLGMEDQIVYSSFNHRSVMRIRELDSHAKTAFLYEDGFLDMPEYASRHGVTALHPALYNLQYPGFLEECRRRAIKVRTWTVNEREHMELVCGYELEAMITNYPDIGKQISEQYAGRDV